MDYVLNHSGTGTAWFQDALGNADSPYRNYYVFSDNPSAKAAQDYMALAKEYLEIS